MVTLNVGIDASQGKKGAKDFEQSASKVKKAAGGVTKSNKSLSDSFKRTGQSIRLVDGPLGGVASRFQTLSGIVKNGTVLIVGFTVALAGVGFAARKFIKNTIIQEKAVAQLNARIKSTGGAAGLTSKELQKMASALQKVTTFGDEATIAAQGILLTFTKIGRDAFPLALKAVQNMSIAMGVDLKSAALQVGKALNDPILGVTALQRSGIQFTKSQKDVIKSLVETGEIRLAER